MVFVLEGHAYISNGILIAIDFTCLLERKNI